MVYRKYPGKYKSATVKFITAEFGMSVYLMKLTDKKMTSAQFMSMINKIRPNSILCFDEIDKYFIEFDKYGETFDIQPSDLLTALDGPGRLPKGTIVIMTATNFDPFPKNLIPQLFRPGRIDHAIEYV